MTLLETAFWISVAVPVYSYGVYPVLARWLAARSPDPLAASLRKPPEQWPLVSLVIAAYREESVILNRVHNALQLDYPADRLEILICVDGEEDSTGELVAGIDDDRVRLLQYTRRRGKTSVLNDSIPRARGEILILSDANTDMDPQAARKLVRHFERPEVGGVCGRLVLTDGETGDNVDGAYWRFENFLKRCEGRFGALLGVNGAIYAIRRELFQPLPPETIIDDFVIGMRIHLQGLQLLYDPEAVAREETAPRMAGEFHRRARIGAGGFQSLPWLWRLLNPVRGRVAFAFWSHKILRWTCPLALLVALGTNLALATQAPYNLLLVGHLFCYALAAAGFLVRPLGVGRRVLRLASMFVTINAALAVGFWRWVGGRRKAAWKRTDRSENEQQVDGQSAAVEEAAAERITT